MNVLFWKLILQWCITIDVYFVYQFHFSIMEMRTASPRRDVGTKKYRTHLFSLQAYRDGPMYNWPVRVRNCRVFEKKRKTEKEEWSGRVKQESKEPGREVHSTLYFRIIGRANRNWAESMTCLPLRARRAARIHLFITCVYLGRFCTNGTLTDINVENYNQAQ